MATTKLIDELAFANLSISAPRLYVNPEITIAVGQKDVYADIYVQVPLYYISGLRSVLISSTPPDIAYFQKLPEHNLNDRLWAIYAVVVEDRDNEYSLYIGSGTLKDYGFSARLREYKTHKDLPQFVKRALNDEGHISHIGLIY